MSGMDRLTDELLEAYASGKWKSYERDNIAMARELLTHRRASQASPAPSEPVTLTYTNWQGKTAQRNITPVRVWFGSTPWHPEPQWLLTAVDAEKGLERDFALKDFGAPAPSDGLRGLVVKPLEWEGKPSDCYMQAETILGHYRIYVQYRDEWTCDFEPSSGRPVNVRCWATTPDDCKAAAQADHDVRIRAALSAPAQEGGE